MSDQTPETDTFAEDLRLAKDSCEEVMDSLRSSQIGKEHPPGLLTYWNDLLVGWLPRVGEIRSEWFSTWKTLSAEVEEARAGTLGALVESGEKITKARELARHDEGAARLNSLATKAQVRYFEADTYYDVLKEAIQVNKANLKSRKEGYVPESM